MSSGGCLYHNVIKTAKIMKQCVILGADKSHGDCPSDCGHLDRVGQPVVHYSACRHGRDHLRHIGEAGERGRSQIAPGRSGTQTRRARTDQSCSGRDLESRTSMARTLPISAYHIPVLIEVTEASARWCDLGTSPKR